MKLTEEQIEWIQKINNGKIREIAEYIEQNFSFKSIKRPVNNQPCLEIDFENKSDSSRKIIRFISFCYFLESQKLLNMLIFKANSRSDIIVNGKPLIVSDSPFMQSILIYNHLHQKYFVPTPLLDEYIKSGFKTTEELQIEHDKASFKKNYFWTRVSVFIAIAISLITTIFNYLTYTNERNVYVKNLQNISTPLDVHIIDTENVEGTINEKQIP